MSKAAALILRFTKGYCEEALGNEIYLSDTFLNEEVIESLFDSTENLVEIFEQGKKFMGKYEVFYSIRHKKWLTYPNNWTLSIRHFGVLLEDWNFVNAFDERGVKNV